MKLNPQLQILVCILLQWDRGQPKAVSARQLQDLVQVEGKRFASTMNELTRSEYIESVRRESGTYHSIKGRGVDLFCREQLCSFGRQRLPVLGGAVREALAKTIAGYYSGSEIRAFLERVGLAAAGWQGRGTKWRELNGILESWQGAAHVLVYYVGVSFLERANLVGISDEERNGLSRGINQILAAQGVALSRERGIVLVSEEQALRMGIGVEVVAAVESYDWHDNEVIALAEVLHDYSMCRTRREARDWLSEAVGAAAPSALRGAEGVLEYWYRALLDVVQQHGPGSVVSILGRLSNPRERMPYGDFEELRQRLNRVLEWSPIGIRSDGVIGLENASAGSSAQASRPGSELRGVPVERDVVSRFLAVASEDEATTFLIAPILRMSGFLSVEVKGHRDKSGEYGQDIRQMKLVLPTGHALFFAAQVKTGDISADARSGGANVENVLTQARMALGKKTWDAATQAFVAVNHVLLVATGQITESARTYLQDQLADGSRSVLLLDQEGLLGMLERFGLPPRPAEAIAEVSRRN